MNLLILPHQLFDKKYIPKDSKIIIWEHPQYFKSYNYNKKKLILHRASMQYYYDYLLDNNYDVLDYFNFNDKFNFKGSLMVFDPIDKIDIPSPNLKILDSPNFLLSIELCEKYRDKTDKFFFNAFYMWGKKQLNIIPNVKSKDKENREGKLAKGTVIPKLAGISKDDKYYIRDAEKYIIKHFKGNLGTINGFDYPITHNTAKRWLKWFIKKKFKNFGKYQDTIVKDEDGERKRTDYLFHSVLSSSINIGLLCPDDIIDEIDKYKSKIPINSYEAYIRQLFWREYQRYTYIYFDFKGNYFSNRKKLDKSWYNGTLGIPPVDDAIVRGIETGYLHHILRLMVVGNYMNLSGISPDEGFRWFMEFSCDSYEWVMHQNVLEMVFFVSGGKTMRKPYISSSNYILKMSNYSSKGEWTDIWDDKYHDFIKKNKKKLYKFRYYFRNI